MHPPSPSLSPLLTLTSLPPSHLLHPHTSLAVEQVTEKVVEMTLEGDKKATAPVPVVPLVGVVGGADDSDSDSEPAVDIDEYPLEEDDPVREKGV